jgi:Na+/H+-dicarboxylate symporter
MNLFETKKTFTGRYLKNLTLYVFAAILGGVLTGHYAPEASIKLGMVSRYFFMVLEMLILPIIFMAIMYGICQLSGIRECEQHCLENHSVFSDHQFCGHYYRIYFRFCRKTRS